MRIFGSFLLALVVYFSILYFIFFFLFPKKEPKKEVLIHTAIINSTNITPKKSQKKSIIQEQKVSKVVKKAKKIGSKKNITKGGEKISFDEIFKNVKANVKTTKLKQKKEDRMSRFRGLEKIEKKLKKLKTANVDITIDSSSGKKGDNDKIINKIGQVWYEVSDIAGEYAKIHVINKNGDVEVYILDSNLDSDKQEELVRKIEMLNFDKNFDLYIKFQTKVNK
jgi:hypothetical protein